MWGRGSPSPEEAPCGALGPPVPSSCRSSAPPRPLKGPRPGAGSAEPGVRPLPPPRRREWLQPGPRPPAPCFRGAAPPREFSQAGGADASGADHLRVSERRAEALGSWGVGRPSPPGI